VDSPRRKRFLEVLHGRSTFSLDINFREEVEEVAEEKDLVSV
jgi:hypothetical protein